MNKQYMKTTEAVKVLSNAFKKNPDYRNAWKANIAMAFVDNHRWYKDKTGKKTVSNQDVREIANDAAEYFLQLLVS